MRLNHAHAYTAVEFTGYEVIEQLHAQMEHLIQVTAQSTSPPVILEFETFAQNSGALHAVTNHALLASTEYYKHMQCMLYGV